jgi:gustatory receptor
LYNDIIDLSSAVEKFLGFIFLSTFTSIFVVTTTQIYHCYTLAASQAKHMIGYSWWTIVMSVNIIFLNVISTVAITSLCEMISSEVR